MITERFIPLSRLIRGRQRKLSPDQVALLVVHLTASRDCKAFLESREPRRYGILSSSKETPSEAEEKAMSASRFVLEKAFEYYSRHDRLDRAYDELREVARMHWPPVIFEFWAQHFSRAAEAYNAHDALSDRLVDRLAHDLRVERHSVEEDRRLLEAAKGRKGKAN